MPVKNAVIHHIDKKPDGSPAVLHLVDSPLVDSDALDNLQWNVSEAYNAKQGKAWGLFHGESGAYPFSGWLGSYLDGKQSFIDFTREAAEHLTKLLEESNLATGGHVLFSHYQRGMTEYLTIAVLQQAEVQALGPNLEVITTRYLDTGYITQAARINLSVWRNNPKSRQYISYFKGAKGRKSSEQFRDFIGCQEGVDGPGETRTLLKAFSDYIEREDVAEVVAREKTAALLDYASAQGKLGEPVTLAELSELLDEDRPQNFAEFIRAGDYGLPREIPADKRTLNQFKRFTCSVEGLSISFEAHMLGKRVEFDQDASTLTIKGVPPALAKQLNRAIS